jgi:uncharacterized protein YjbI with pentapeptide repeats
MQGDHLPVLFREVSMRYMSVDGQHAGIMLACLAATAIPVWAQAGDLSREQVLQIIQSTPAGGAPDLVETELRGLDLSGVDFKGAMLRGAVLKGANLAGANLAGANLDVTVFSEANLAGADLSGASLYGTVMREANLRDADLSEAVLLGNLKQADLSGTDLTGLRGGANMSNQSMGLIRLVITNARLEGARMKNADLAVCDARFASFRSAELEGANFTECDLRQADFTGANLARADFSRAKLHGAVFKDIRGKDSIVGLDTAEGIDEAKF